MFYHKNKPQCGRSMIEMLGVLAIIGVLSVGGIVGFQKALLKHQTHKTLEQMMLIYSNIRRAYRHEKTYDGITRNISLYKMLNLIPEEMYNSAGTSLINIWGSEWTIRPANRGDGIKKALEFEIYNIPEGACITLATQSNFYQLIGFWRRASEGARNDYYLVPLTPDRATIECAKGYNSLLFYFDIDTTSAYWQRQIAP